MEIVYLNKGVKECKKSLHLDYFVVHPGDMMKMM